MTTAIEYALMAGASYISTRSDVNQFTVQLQDKRHPPGAGCLETASLYGFPRSDRRNQEKHQ